MEGVCSSEASVNIYQITPCHIPEGCTLYSYHYETQQSNIHIDFLFDRENNSESRETCQK
jgi:hypothetical protein